MAEQVARDVIGQMFTLDRMYDLDYELATRNDDGAVSREWGDAILAALKAAGFRVAPEADLAKVVAFVEAFENLCQSDLCWEDLADVHTAVEPVLARWKEQGAQGWT